MPKIPTLSEENLARAARDELTGVIYETGKTPNSAEKPYKLAKNILFALLSGLFINTLFGLLIDHHEILDAIYLVRIQQIALPFLAIIVVYLIDSLRYLLVFRQFGVRLSFSDALYNNILGYFISGITPSSAGGQPFQVYHFTKLGLDSTSATNIVFSRLMVANLAQLAVVLAFLKQGISLLSAAGKGIFILGLGMLTTIVFSVILFMIFVKPDMLGTLTLRMEGTRLGHFISKRTKDEHWAEKISTWSFGLRDSFRYLWAGRTWTMILDVALFGMDQVIWAYGLYYPLVALTGTQLHFGGFLFAFILCGLVSAYIPTPGASGSIETSYALVLGGITGAPGAALSAIILWRLGSYYLHLILGGLVYALVPVTRNCYAKDEGGLIRKIGAPSSP